MKKCIRPPYEKLKSLKSGIIGNSNFENNRDPWSKKTSRDQSFERTSFLKEHSYDLRKIEVWLNILDFF